MAAFNPKLNRDALFFVRMLLPERNQENSVVKDLVANPRKRYLGWTLKQYLDYLSVVDAAKGSNALRNALKGRVSLDDLTPEEIGKILEETTTRSFDLEAGLREAASTMGANLERVSKEEAQGAVLREKEEPGQTTPQQAPGEATTSAAQPPQEPQTSFALFENEHPSQLPAIEATSLPKAPLSQRLGENLFKGVQSRLSSPLKNLGSILQRWVHNNVHFPTVVGMAMGAALLGVSNGLPGLAVGLIGGGALGKFSEGFIQSKLSPPSSGSAEGEIASGATLEGGTTNPQSEEELLENLPPGEPEYMDEEGPGRQAPPQTPPLFGTPFSGFPSFVRRSSMVYLIIGLIILGLFLFLMMGGAGTGNGQPSPTPNPSSSNQITITKSGPDSAAIGQEIPYIITVTYTGSGTANVTVNDKLDSQVYFRSASDNGLEQNGVVTWNISNLVANTPKLLQLTVTPAVPSDSPGIWVVNSAQATINSTTGGGSGTFDTLMRGKGSIDPVGSANALISRAANVFPVLQGKTQQLTDLYNVAISYNINPVALLTIWKVENRDFSNYSSFNCPPAARGGNPDFSVQLNCAATTLRFYMNQFNQNAQGGTYALPNAPACVYNDPFLYAYELYTPVCATNDNNGTARGNFVNIYNQLVGQ